MRSIGGYTFAAGPFQERLGGQSLEAFLAAASLVVAYFSTLLLNFCDFSRFSPSRRMVRWGSFWGLSVNFMAFSLIVASGSVTVYGEAIEGPVEPVLRIPSRLVLAIAAVTFAIATVGINIVADFVSPA